MKLNDTKQVISILQENINSIREQQQYITVNNRPQEYGTEKDYQHINRLLNDGVIEAEELSYLLQKQISYISRKKKEKKWEN